MAVLPQFEPAAPATEPAKNVQSWMNQAQERQMRGQQMQENQMRLNVMGPVIQAKAQADLATAVSDIATAKSNLDQTTFKAGQRARYAQSQLGIASELDGIIAGADTPAYAEAPPLPDGASPQEVIAYRKEQAQADREHTSAALEQQEASLSRWMAKYNWINDTPDGANLFKMADTARGRIFQTRLNENITDRILEKTGMEQAGKEELEQMRADAQKDVQAMRDQAILDREKIQQEGISRKEKQDATMKEWQTRQQMRTKAWQELAKAAIASGQPVPAFKIEEMPDPFADEGAGVSVSTAATQSKYKAPKEVVDAIKSKAITREQGLQILREQFGMQ
jgi:hypothetical protein